jgi:hypothetical protein
MGVRRRWLASFGRLPDDGNGRIACNLCKQKGRGRTEDAAGAVTVWRPLLYYVTLLLT